MIQIGERLPTPDEYVSLRLAVGWKVPGLDDCDRALRQTQAAVCAFSEGELIGMARLVGDGAFYWLMVDVVVVPQHQRCGVGSGMVSALESIAARTSVTGVVNLV
jgi:GNAT superfamily N-acetyltransferase